MSRGAQGRGGAPGKASFLLPCTSSLTLRSGIRSQSPSSLRLQSNRVRVAICLLLCLFNRLHIIRRYLDAIGAQGVMTVFHVEQCGGRTAGRCLVHRCRGVGAGGQGRRRPVGPGAQECADRSSKRTRATLCANVHTLSDKRMKRKDLTTVWEYDSMDT